MYRLISGHLLRKAGLTPAIAAIGAVTPMQRFDTAPNLNIHFHMRVPDGVYRNAPADPEASRPDVAENSGFSLHAAVWARGSEPEKLEQLSRYVSRPPLAIATRLVDFHRILPRDRHRILSRLKISTAKPRLTCRDSGRIKFRCKLRPEMAHSGTQVNDSITCRIAAGPREGQKVFRLQPLPPEPDRSRTVVAASSGFSLHSESAAHSEAYPVMAEALAFAIFSRVGRNSLWIYRR